MKIEVTNVSPQTRPCLVSEQDEKMQSSAIICFYPRYQPTRSSLPARSPGLVGSVVKRLVAAGDRGQGPEIDASFITDSSDWGVIHFFGGSFSPSE